MAAANIHEKYFKINTLLSSHPLKTSKVYCVKVIYVTKNISQGWNGTFKNNPQPGGTFVWTVSGTDYKGNKIIRNGTVVLIR